MIHVHVAVDSPVGADYIPDTTYKSLEELINVIRDFVDMIDVMKPVYIFKTEGTNMCCRLRCIYECKCTRYRTIRFLCREFGILDRLRYLAIVLLGTAIPSSVNLIASC